MIVNFDKLNKFEIPKLSLCNPSSGVTISNNFVYLSNCLGIINNASPPRFVFNHNAPSELYITCVHNYTENSEENKQNQKVYDGLVKKRYIYVDEYGYFLITEVEESCSKNIWTKEITAKTCEIELETFPLPYISTDDDVQLFYIADLLKKVLLTDSENVIKTRWTVSHIDSSLSNINRAFDTIDKDNIYDFIIDDVQNAYNCIFEFDNISRTMSVYSIENYTNGKITNIHLSRSNFETEIKMKESPEDDIYTAIEVSGDNELDIIAANPMGTNTIYNFDEFLNLDWMTSELIYGLTCWKLHCQDVQSAYITYVKASDQTNINSIITGSQFNQFLEEEQLLELSSFIYQKKYNDSYVTVTEAMDTSAKVDQSKILFDRATEYLSKISTKTRSFDITTEPFVFNKEFSPYTSQLESGCIIHAETKDDVMEELFLNTIDVNFNDKTLQLTFGNKYNKNDIKSLYDDVFEDTLSGKLSDSGWLTGSGTKGFTIKSRVYGKCLYVKAYGSNTSGATIPAGSVLATMNSAHTRYIKKDWKFISVYIVDTYNYTVTFTINTSGQLIAVATALSTGNKIDVNSSILIN